MTLPVAPNTISMSDVNTELGLSLTNSSSLNDTAVRSLAGLTTPQSTISMADLRGKSAAIALIGCAVSPSSWTGNAVTGGGIQTSGTFSLSYYTPSNATGPFTYSWIKTGGTTLTVNSPTSSSTTFSGSVPAPNTSVIGKYKLQITGPKNFTTSGEITITFVRSAYLLETAHAFSNEKIAFPGLPEEADFVKKFNQTKGN